MKIYTLITVPKIEFLKNCTLLFDSFRVGFPTSDLTVTVNTQLCDPLAVWDIFNRVYSVTKYCYAATEPLNLGDWIEKTLRSHVERFGNEPAVFLDGDMIFWSSAEDWSFDTLVAGYYIPTIWNDFSQCVSFERFHTSFLWFQKPKDLLEEIHKSYPNADDSAGEYCPVAPFNARVMFVRGTPFYWDCASVLYNMVGGTAFGAKHLAAFDHLNSAAFYDVMYARLENKQGFELLHKTLVKTPEVLRGMWDGVVNPYYAEKHQQAMKYLATLSPSIQKSLAPLL